MSIIALILLIPLAAIVLDSPLGRAAASRLQVMGRSREVSKGAEERIAALEGEVERLGREVTYLSEQSRFLSDLLSEAPELPKPGSGGR